MTVGQVVVHSRCQSVHTERSGRELSTRISSGGRRCACRASQSLTIHIYTYPPIQQQQQEVECNGTKCSHWWDRRQMGIPIILCTCLFTLGGANQSVLMLDMSLGRDNKWTANKSWDWMTDKDGSFFVTMIVYDESLINYINLYEINIHYDLPIGTFPWIENLSNCNQQNLQ